tara:strand:+ start:99 stop:941 length:843 start_codon:yes stop_codon:yes gene_type:complete
MKIEKPVAAISMVRNDVFFADKWISYYGTQFGYENLYLIIDGMDQPLPKEASKINCFQIPHQNLKRAKGDRKRAKKISEFASTLYPKYKAVLAMDIDEFLVVDPKMKISLKAYLKKDFKTDSISALGLDVGQHPKFENGIDLKKTFLSQRQFAKVSDRYTKPIVSFKPLEWGSGFHRIKGKDYVIDPNLFLFHFGLVSKEITDKKSNKSELLNLGWRGHMARRFRLFKELETQTPQEGDMFFEKARHYLNKSRKWYSWNKPAPLKGPSIIKIPKRFQTIV